VQGLHEIAAGAGLSTAPSEPHLASAIDFALESLCAQKKLSRSDDWRYSAGDTVAVRRPQPARRGQDTLEDDDLGYQGPGKKKYYN
jgi:hypothetical protein